MSAQPGSDAIAQLDRRGFLRLAGAASAAGLLPLGCLAPDRRDRVLRAVARRIAGPTATARIDAGDVDPAAVFGPWLERLGPLADTLEIGLATLEYGVWPLVPKLRPFSALEGADQDAVLTALRESRFGLKRQLFAAAKLVGCVVWYTSPESHAGVGYPGPFADPGPALVWSDDA
jgi:hypothetical protein